MASSVFEGDLFRESLRDLAQWFKTWRFLSKIFAESNKGFSIKTYFSSNDNFLCEILILSRKTSLTQLIGDGLEDQVIFQRPEFAIEVSK